MPAKFGALLWKEVGYRSRFTTFLPLIVLVVLGGLGNVRIIKITIKEVGRNLQNFTLSPVNNCIEIPSGEKLQKISYEPSSPFLTEFMKRVSCAGTYNVTLADLQSENEYDFEIKFNGIKSDQMDPPGSLDYFIYPTDSMDPAHSSKPWERPRDINGPHMLSSLPPIFELQRTIDSVFLQMKEVPEIETTTLILEPQSKYLSRAKYALHAEYIIFLPLIFLIIETDKFLTCILREKNAGLMEFLKIMGISKFQLRLAEFVTSMIVHIINIVVAVCLLYIALTDDSFVYKFANPGIMLGSLILAAVSATNFVYFISFLFRSEMLASNINGLCWFTALIFSLLSLQPTQGDFSKVTHGVLSLLPQVWSIEVLMLLSTYELYGKSVQLYESLTPLEDSLTFSNLILIGLGESIMYFLLGVYLENILPGKYGRSHPFYYCFTKSFWVGKEKIKELKSEGETNKDRALFEEVPKTLAPGIAIQNLSKAYQSRKNNVALALNNVSFNFYEGEITGLLGHNGAGKTTLISILCGMIPASSGKIFIKEQDILRNPGHLRKNIGYCPQTEILIDGLSVEKNLIFFGMAKNLSKKEAKKEADDYIKRMNLIESKSHLAKNLSGGQRRKLSLSVALIGSPEVVLLDEPSTGIDVSTRHQIWEILLELRGKKTIILSTHFMEEADALSDRIIVLAHGQTHCYGTPMFLKSKFGAGYTLSIVAPKKDQVNAVTDLVKKYVKGANFKYQNVLTLIYQLPEKELGSFPELFETLDTKIKGGEIVSFNVTISTMEDVFLNIDSAIKEDFAIKKGITGKETPAHEDFSEETSRKPSLKGCRLQCNQLGGLLIKKWIYFKRNFPAFFVMGAVILGLTILLDFYTKTTLRNKYQTNVDYSLKFYGQPEILYSSTRDDDDLINSLQKLIVESGSKIRKVDSVKEELNEIFKDDIQKYYNSFIAFEFSEDIINILYNEHAIHGMSIAVNILHNALLDSKNSSIKTTMELTRLESISLSAIPKEKKDYAACKIVAIMILLRASNLFFLAFMMGPMEERSTHLKVYQLMLVNPAIYWLSHCIFDFPIVFVYNILSLISLGSIEEIFRDYLLEKAGKTIIILFFLCFCNLLITYLGTVLFKRYLSAALFSAALQFVPTIAVTIIASIYPTLKFLKYFTPATVLQTYMDGSCSDELGNTGKSEVEEKIEYTYLALCLYPVALTLLIILLDMRILPKIIHPIMTLLMCIRFRFLHPPDPTVQEEKKVVKNLKKTKRLSDKVLVVDHLRRWFCTCKCSCKHNYNCINTAVKGVTFTIGEEECFGLLGVNGAGKSTIFNTLTGNIIPSRGGAYLRSTSITNCVLRKNTFFKMGYCPQFGNYFPKFKGREMLELFGRLRGLKGSELKKEVGYRIKQILLEEHEKKKCKTYSGGTLRKLAVIMAIIGNPDIALLDEPTTGIDPAARRAIWDLINSYRETGHSILLTSHSMDECEALSTRLAIMTQGQLRCIGETTTLKSMFGMNYCVVLKTNVKATEDDRLKLRNAMISIFGPGCQLMDEHMTISQYQIPKESATWKKLFSELNVLKSKFPILESFFASSTTLEQIFLHFTRQ